MAAPTNALSASLETLRDRARRLEEEAAALRADLEQMVALAEWQTGHTVSVETLLQTPVTDGEVTQYRAMLGGDYSDDVLKLTLQAHKLATLLKHSVARVERERAIGAVIEALHAAAEAQGTEVPRELEAVVGD